MPNTSGNMLDSYYFNEVGRHDLLTREEEVALARRSRKGDKNARDKLVLSNLRLAIKIAKEFHGKSKCSLEDLIQESNLGLCKAVELFDPDRGFKFSTYASWWMKQRVRSHILGNSGIARLPGNARMINWQAKQKTKEYEEEFGRSPTLQELADLLNVSTSVMRGVRSCSSYPVNLDAQVNDENSVARPFHETIEDETIEDASNTIDKNRLIKAIYESMSSLTKREQVVLRLRFGLIDDLKSDPDFSPQRLVLSAQESE